MKILFIGGNGNISWHCVQKALERGHEVWELNRGQTRLTRRAVQEKVHQLLCDIRSAEAAKECLKNLSFDVVCDFICYNSNQAKQAIELFEGNIGQYIYVSSEAVISRSKNQIPYSEESETIDENDEDAFPYSIGKAQAEATFMRAFRERKFPVTIIRPGYTYDTIFPMPIGWNCFSAPSLLLQGYPYLMPGDGNGLRALLRSEDFARAYVEIIGRKQCIGECYQIVSDELVTWNEVAKYTLEALGIPNREIIHFSARIVDEIDIGIDSKKLATQDLNNYIFDITKIRSVVPSWSYTIPFERGIKLTTQWLMEDKVRCRVSREYVERLKKLYNAIER